MRGKEPLDPTGTPSDRLEVAAQIIMMWKLRREDQPGGGEEEKKKEAKRKRKEEMRPIRDASEFLQFVCDNLFEDKVLHQAWSFTEVASKMCECDDKSAPTHDWVREDSLAGLRVTCDLTDGLSRTLAARVRKMERIEDYACDHETEVPHPVNGDQVKVRCAGKKAKYTTVVLGAPPLMVLHVNRFNYEVKNARDGSIICTTKKANGKMDFSEEVLVGEVSYRLVAVVQHNGRTAGGGHYVAFVRNGDMDQRDGWRKMDDLRQGGKPQKVVREQVLGAEAYVLLYEKASVWPQAQVLPKKRGGGPEDLPPNKRRKRGGNRSSFDEETSGYLNRPLDLIKDWLDGLDEHTKEQWHEAIGNTPLARVTPGVSNANVASVSFLNVEAVTEHFGGKDHGAGKPTVTAAQKRKRDDRAIAVHTMAHVISCMKEWNARQMDRQARGDLMEVQFDAEQESREKIWETLRLFHRHPAQHDKTTPLVKLLRKVLPGQPQESQPGDAQPTSAHAYQTWVQMQVLLASIFADARGLLKLDVTLSAKKLSCKSLIADHKELQPTRYSVEPGRLPEWAQGLAMAVRDRCIEADPAPLTDDELRMIGRMHERTGVVVRAPITHAVTTSNQEERAGTLTFWVTVARCEHWLVPVIGEWIREENEKPLRLHLFDPNGRFVEGFDRCIDTRVDVWHHTSMVHEFIQYVEGWEELTDVGSAFAFNGPLYDTDALNELLGMILPDSEVVEVRIGQRTTLSEAAKRHLVAEEWVERYVVENMELQDDRGLCRKYWANTRMLCHHCLRPLRFVHTSKDEFKDLKVYAKNKKRYLHRGCEKKVVSLHSVLVGFARMSENSQVVDIESDSE